MEYPTFKEFGIHSSVIEILRTSISKAITSERVMFIKRTFSNYGYTEADILYLTYASFLAEKYPDITNLTNEYEQGSALLSLFYAGNELKVNTECLFIRAILTPLQKIRKVYINDIRLPLDYLDIYQTEVQIRTKAVYPKSNTHLGNSKISVYINNAKYEFESFEVGNTNLKLYTS